MFEFVLLLTGIVVAAAALFAYVRTRDALHPAVILAPVLGYVYAFWPLVLNKAGGIQRLLGPAQANYIALLYGAGVLCFFAGMVRTCAAGSPLPTGAEGGAGRSFMPGALDPRRRRRCYSLALALGAVSVSAYLYMLSNVGGFLAAYSVAKGGGYALSGYIGESILLSFPAVILLALARQGTERPRVRDVLAAVAIVSPHLLQGTFGGRRGPLFLSLSVLLFGWFLVKGRRPRPLPIVLGVCFIGACVVLVQSQRHHLYLGSGQEFDAGRVTETVGTEGDLEDLALNDYVAGASTVLTADFYGDYYWGYRYLVTVFVRPIPRQLWPTKYEDVDARWLDRWNPETGGGDLLQAVGFLPPEGSSVGFLADIYYEFSWGFLVVVYLFGRGLAGLWRRHRTRGGLWTILFIEAMILGIYIPTQSFSAWFHRFLIMSAVTVLVWRYWFHRRGAPLPPRPSTALPLPSPTGVLRP